MSLNVRQLLNLILQLHRLQMSKWVHIPDWMTPVLMQLVDRQHALLMLDL
jgi:hypothetical protein